MTTQMHRIVCVLLVALMGGLVLAGWFLVAQPQLASASDSNTQLEAQEAQIATSQSNLQHLRDQKGRLTQLSAQLASLQTSIPADLASSPLVAGIDREASAAGVVITDISVDDPKTYAPAPPATGGSAASGSAQPTASASPSPTPSATPAATAAPYTLRMKSYAPRTDSRITAANFIPIPVSITVKGQWGPTLQFVKNLQSGERLYAVGTLGTKTDPDDPSTYTTIVSGYVFAILDPASLAAETAKKTADAAAEKAAKPTPSPTPSGTSKPAPTASTKPVPSGSPTPSVTPSR